MKQLGGVLGVPKNCFWDPQKNSLWEDLNTRSKKLNTRLEIVCVGLKPPPEGAISCKFNMRPPRQALISCGTVNPSRIIHKY